MLGTICWLAGALLIVGSTIWLLIEAFRQGILWGLAVLFLSPPLALIFIIVHWEKAKGAVGYYLLGWILIVAGVVLSGHRRERLVGAHGQHRAACTLVAHHPTVRPSS